MTSLKAIYFTLLTDNSISRSVPDLTIYALFADVNNILCNVNWKRVYLEQF